MDEALWVPLFPLDSLVLVPGQTQVLHVFEPRYRELVADAMQGNQLVGMALYDGQREPEADGTPPVHHVLGVGRIVAHKELEDGRSLIQLYGIGRFAIREEDRSRSYRLARLERLPSTHEDSELTAVFAMALRLLERLGIQDENATSASTGQEARFAELLSDRALAQLPMDTMRRQQGLTILDLGKRLRFLHRVLDEIEHPPQPTDN